MDLSQVENLLSLFPYWIALLVAALALMLFLLPRNAISGLGRFVAGSAGALLYCVLSVVTGAEVLADSLTSAYLTQFVRDLGLIAVGALLCGGYLAQKIAEFPVFSSFASFPPAFLLGVIGSAAFTLLIHTIVFVVRYLT